MSTLKKNITAQRMVLLAAKNETLFHTDDLANLWNIKNKANLRTTLKRYVNNGLLNRIYRGFYSLILPSQINPILLGAKALHRFCYLTTETILFWEGYLSQKPQSYTFVSEKALRLSCLGHEFKSRQLHPKYLYNPAGISLKEGVNQASPERAIADLLYFNPRAHWDKPVDWKAIKKIQQEIGYPLTPRRYDFTQTRRRHS